MSAWKGMKPGDLPQPKEVTAETFIKVGTTYIPVEKFTGPILDPEYVSGSIELRVGQTCLLTKGMWDDVNWLWGYLLGALKELSDGKRKYTMSFPDQPIPMKFSVSGTGDILTVWVEFQGSRQAKVKHSEFRQEMLKAAKTFLLKCVSLVPPGKRAAYERDLKIVAELEAL